MPSFRYTLLSLGCITAVGMYWLTFLRQPIVEGVSEITRGAFLLNTLLVPESVISSWTGNGRLTLGWLDRLPIISSTFAWLGLSCLLVVGHCQWAATVGLRSAAARLTSQRLFTLSLSTLVGLAILSTATLLVGLAGGLSSRLPLIAVLGALLVLSYYLRRSMRRSFAAAQPWAEDTNSSLPATDAVAGQVHHGPFDRALRVVAIALTLWCGSVMMLGAWVPPAEFDVLEYHLQAPKEFYQQGAVTFVPHNIYANMPLGVEMHALAAMTLWQEPDAWLGGLIGKSISAAISLLGAALLGSWLAMRYGNLAGWWSASIWLATPGIAHVAMQGLIDGALATYCLASAIAAWQMIAAVHAGQRPELVLRWAALAAVLSGATAAIKYPGLIFATLPCLLVIGWYGSRLWIQKQRTHLWPLTAIAIASLLVTCVPWYSKNWLLAGNPVYPLAANLFGGQTLTADKIAQWQKAHRVPPAATLPQDATRLLVSSSFVQPAMILGLTVAVVMLVQQLLHHRSLTWRDHPWHFILAWSLWMLAVWWFTTHRIDRFWLPLTGMWAALAAWALGRVSHRSIWLAHAIVIPGLIYGALINSSPVVSDNRYFVSLAALRDDMGDAEMPPRIPLALGWINQHLDGQKHKVLLVGEARVFEYRVPVVYSTCFDINPGEASLAGQSLADQREAMQAAGITHIMINWTEIQRYRSPGNYGFSAWPQPRDVQAMIDSGLVVPVKWDLNDQQAQLLEVKFND